jgi:hypothetical protein
LKFGVRERREEEGRGVGGGEEREEEGEVNAEEKVRRKSRIRSAYGKCRG